MSKWDKISLFTFQQIDQINANDQMDSVDKILFSACQVFDLTEYEMDQLGAARANRLAQKVSAIFATPFNPAPRKKIGKYFVKYDLGKMTLGQYIELSFFLQHYLQNAHYVMASISNRCWRKNNSKDHKRKAEYFLQRPVTEIMGSLKLFIQRFTDFNAEYKSLFGLDPETSGDAQSDKFNKRYGWIYAASQVAEYERITLDQAFALPVRRAFNDLAYLKAKGIYEAEQLKKKR